MEPLRTAQPQRLEPGREVLAFGGADQEQGCSRSQGLDVLRAAGPLGDACQFTGVN